MTWLSKQTEKVAGHFGYYKCVCCGRFQKGPPLSYFLQYPDYWFEVPEPERTRRSRFYEENELCQIDQNCFVKCNLHLPIEKSKQSFVWTVWISLSEVNFARARKLWDSPERVDEPPYFGWLSTSLPGYPEPTANLRTNFHFHRLGLRSWIELEPSEHLLSVEQRNGITMDRVREFASIFHRQARDSEKAS